MDSKIGKAYLKRGKYMTSKHKLYKIALVSIFVVLMLVSTVSASRHENGNVILKTDSCTGFVDFLKFPACGCDWGCGSQTWGHGETARRDADPEVILKTDSCTGFVDFLKFPAC
jgi:hypothetical protein